MVSDSNPIDEVVSAASLRMEAGRISNAAIVAAHAARLAHVIAVQPLDGIAPLGEIEASQISAMAFHTAFHEYLHGGCEGD